MDVSLTIGIPTTGDVKIDMACDLAESMCYLRCPVNIATERSCYVHENREKLVHDAIKAGSTHLMFIDSDMHFPPDAINKLIELDKDVVAAMACCRHLPLEVTVKMEGNDGKLKAGPASELPKDLFKCSSIGTGFMLIKMDVFKRIDKPWFSFDKTPDGMLIGEDIFFCNQCKKAGIDIWCDPTIPIKHIGDFAY